MSVPRAVDIKQSLAKTSLLLDQLETQIEERDRLISVLKLTPSSNDNLELVNHLDKLKKLTTYLQEDIYLFLQTTGKDDHGFIPQIQQLADTYNSSLTSIQDSFINVDEYTLRLRDFTPLVSTDNIKSVRFQDQVDPDEDNQLRNELMGTNHFKPYTDDESDAASESGTLGLINQSNQELFVQHQQQMLSQDQDLDTLHDSIRIQRSLGENINTELDDHLILLNDLEQGVDRSQYNLDRAHRRLRDFNTKVRENGSLVTIIILTVILILLLVVLN